MDVQPNWWETFFGGVAVDMWLQGLPPEHTRREAERIEKLIDVPPGAEVLDVPCGAGRLTLELAARGYHMTGVDLSAEFLAHARERDPLHRVAWEQRDMRDLPWLGRFDGAFCYGNSFGYLDDQGNAAFLRAVASALKPGGRFILETPMVIETLLPMLEDRAWFPAGDIYLLVANEYDPFRSRLDIEYTFVRNGQVETRRGTHRAYSCRELVELVQSCGFTVTIDPEWTRASPALTLIATR